MIATAAIGCLAAVAGFRAPAEKPVENAQGGLWIEAESFTDYGSWEVDTQFTHKMGSAYLICPGADRPTAKPARTEVTIGAPRSLGRVCTVRHDSADDGFGVCAV